ncbi:hypothetical protein ACSZMT_19440, partial [Aeromonas veronii]
INVIARASCMETRLDHRRSACSNFINKVRSRPGGRIAAAGATFIGGATGVAGLAYAVGIATHNLVTYNPDYEIVKHVVDKSISVLYKK